MVAYPGFLLMGIGVYRQAGFGEIWKKREILPALFFLCLKESEACCIQ
jgi:hypothetical protein